MLSATVRGRRWFSKAPFKPVEIFTLMRMDTFSLRTSIIVAAHGEYDIGLRIFSTASIADNRTGHLDQKTGLALGLSFKVA